MQVSVMEVDFAIQVELASWKIEDADVHGSITTRTHYNSSSSIRGFGITATETQNPLTIDEKSLDGWFLG